jgi:hypothetical protein
VATIGRARPRASGRKQIAEDDPAVGGEEHAADDAGPGSPVPQAPDYGIDRQAERRRIGRAYACGHTTAAHPKTLDSPLLSEFLAVTGIGLLLTSLSIGLDSFGVGIALLGVGIPLLPLLITVSITTTTFTFIGLAFGARLGERYEHGAECAAGAMLVKLAALFTIERLF